MVAVNVANTESMMEIEILKQFNWWWENYSFRFSMENIIERKIIEEIKEYIEVPQILAILGIRRTGKTTLLRQIINKLLDNKISPKNIFFFSFEQHLGKNTPDILENIINLYFQKVLNKNLMELKEKHFVFLDEIQYIENWQDIIKRYYDLNKNIKFIISGSMSTVIRKKSRESLAGRIFEIHMQFLNFSEFCKIKKSGLDIPTVSTKYILNTDDSTLSKIRDFYSWNASKIESLYEEYIYKGQFPETATLQNDQMVNDYIKTSILKKILIEDSPSIFKIDKSSEFSSVYRIISRETGNLFEIMNLSREIGISKDTLNNYFYYYEQIYLAKIIFNYTKKLRQQYRIHKKFYISSPNFTCNELNINNASLFFNKIIGSLVETDTFQKLANYFETINFWNYRGREVDFVVFYGKDAFPVEVKYLEKISNRDYKTLLEFMEKNKLTTGIVITKNISSIRLEKNKKLIFIPIWTLT